METALYKVIFKDGRMFKIFCANRKQKERFMASMWSIPKEQGHIMYILEVGIHNIKQWEEVIKSTNE